MGFKELKWHHKSFATLLLPGGGIGWEEPDPQRSAEVCKRLAFGINAHQNLFREGEQEEKKEINDKESSLKEFRPRGSKQWGQARNKWRRNDSRSCGRATAALQGWSGPPCVSPPLPVHTSMWTLLEKGDRRQRRGKRWLRRTCAPGVKPFQFYIRKDSVGDPVNAIMPT